MNRFSLASVASAVALAAMVFASCSDDAGPPGSPPDAGAGGGSNADVAVLPSDGGGGQPLGRSCTSDSDCGDLACVRPTDNLAPGYGPPNGVCSRQCTSDSVCIPYGGICMSFDNSSAEGWCVESCAPGNSVSEASKCHGRADEACGPTDRPHSYICWSLCASDADCGSRKCEMATGFCVDTVVAAAPIGTPCDPNATTDACSPGYCQGLSAPDSGPATGFCTVPCRFGGLDGCGYSRNAIGPSTGVVAACMNYPNMDGHGDQGLCWQLCDVASNCVDPSAKCDPAARSLLNHGMCDPTAPYSGDGGTAPPDGAMVSPDGAAAAAGDGAPDVGDARAE
jgi:hypothetical protein